MAPADNHTFQTRRTGASVRFDPTNSRKKSRAKSSRYRHASKLRVRLETTQRDIFDWYETNEYKEDAGAIFSPEWQGRLTEWGNEFDNGSVSDIHHHIKLLQQNSEELELGHFFQVHPIAAFSLWHVLQACYELDRIICGAQNRITIAQWQKWRPFQYLLSLEIRTLWQKRLRILSSEARKSTDKLEREDVARRLQRIAHAVDALEEALLTLTSVFERSFTPPDVRTVPFTAKYRHHQRLLPRRCPGQDLRAMLPSVYHVILIERNSYLHYTFVLPRYFIVLGHEQHAFMPLAAVSGSRLHQMARSR
ncbi:hypothetical protein SCAR479_10052 [Seiridium cardinale]|uniref:Uncharacterized protein n=1 Tax=Seiridium cardinale TaxID=138064 RepID=A0ABR2XHS4_9PEZI